MYSIQDVKKTIDRPLIANVSTAPPLESHKTDKTIKLSNLKSLFDHLKKANLNESGIMSISVKKANDTLSYLKNAQINEIEPFHGLKETTTTKPIIKPDLTLLCKGLVDGEMIGDPFDCTSFYTCNLGKITMKRKCNNNLFFDSNIKVCNWPDQVYEYHSANILVL